MTRLAFRHLLPNGLSVARIGLGLIFPFVPADWRLWIIVAAAISDGLDGLTARWLHAESNTGRLLDPIADKLFVLLVAGTLVWEGRIPVAWAVGIAARDIAVSLGAIVVSVKFGREVLRGMRPSWLGKATTAAQFVVLLAAVIWAEPAVWTLALATALSVAAAMDYVRSFMRNGNHTSR